MKKSFLMIVILLFCINTPAFGAEKIISGNIRLYTDDPFYSATDTSCTDADVNTKIQSMATDTGSGTEDVDMKFYQMVNGSLLMWLHADADGNIDFQNRNITTTGALTIESNTIDFGDVSENYVLTFNASTNTWAGEVVTGGGTQDFADVLGQDPDGGDIDQTSLGRLEFFDSGLFLDADADGVMLISSDGTLELASTDWSISTTGVQTGMGDITSDGTLTITSIDSSGQVDAGTLTINSGSITDTSGAISFGTTGTVTANDVLMTNGSDVRVSTTTTAHEFSIQVYDVDGTAWTDALTFTNADAPSITLGVPLTGSANISATTYGSDASVTDAELLYINTLSSNAQDQIDALVVGFDSTTVDATTWSDGANASNIWTFDVSGTDTTITFGDAGATFAGTWTATAFAGPLTGNVTGNVTGSSGSTTGNAATATALATTRAIGGVNFDGTANIDLSGVNTGGNQDTTGNASTSTLAATMTITDNESTNETNAVVFLPNGDLDGGDLALESDGTFYYNPSTGTVTATTFVGNVTGNVSGNAGTVATITGLAPDTATTQATQPNITSMANMPWTGMKTGTDGEIPTFDASGDPAFVATGTATHVLTSNGVGAAPTFQAAAGGGAIATDAIWDAAGDLVYGTGANTAARLAAGATTEILVGGGAAAPVWTTATGTGAPVRTTSPTLVTPALGTPSAAVLTNATGLPVAGLANGTDGQLITWAADATAAVVATGTATHVLTSNGVGAAPTFQAAAGGAFDSTTVDATTWSDGANASNIWTFDVSGTDTTITFGNAGATFAGTWTATAFVGPLTGNVTGNVSGSSGSTTGNAATATALATTRAIGGVNFDGTAAITPTTIVVADTTDTSSYIALWESATGNLLPKTDAGLTYNAGTGMLTATGLTGPLTGQAATVATITGLAPDTATTQATQAAITSAANLVTVGALNSGSITSGFGTINNGASDITTTGTISGTTFAGAGTSLTGIPLDSDFTQNGGILVGTGAGAYVEETGATLRTSIGVGTGDSPQVTAVNLGHASDTTIARSGAGAVTIESKQVILADTIFTMGKTATEFSNADATPDVSAAATTGAIFYTNANGTITDFDDGDDHSEFSTGDWFLLRVDDASTTIDFSANSNIEGNAGVDFTGSATQITYLLFNFEDSRWNCLTLQNGMSSPTELGISAIDLPSYAHFASADAAYSDTTTPHVLVTAETHNSIITNAGATEDRVYTLHAYDFGMNFMVQVIAGYQMDLEPPSGGVIILNGLAAAADEHIINAADTKGDVLSCWSVETANGTYELFCKSDNSNWAEATPP